MSLTFYCCNLSAASSIDFSQYDNIVQGFVLLSTRLSKALESADFSLLKRAFRGQNPGGMLLTDDLKAKIKEAKKLDDLLDVLVESKYWNFVDLWLINVLVFSSGIREAKVLVDKYKETYFGTKLIDILSSCLKMPSNQQNEYISRVGSIISKEPGEITVADLAEYCTTLDRVIMDINEGSYELLKGSYVVSYTYNYVLHI